MSYDMYSSFKNITLTEAPLPDLMRMQKSIYGLWDKPKFDKRISDVASHGGVHLVGEKKGILHFTVASGTETDLKYDLYVHFTKMKELFRSILTDSKYYKESGEPNYAKLAAQVYNKADLKINCSCPAYKFYGFQYIQTKNKSQYKDRENRRPKVKNPSLQGAYCKHMHLLMNVFPMYVSHIATHLKRYYANDIKIIVKELQNDKK